MAKTTKDGQKQMSLEDLRRYHKSLGVLNDCEEHFPPNIELTDADGKHDGFRTKALIQLRKVNKERKRLLKIILED